MPSYLYGLALSRNAARFPAGVTGIEGEAVRIVVGRQLAGIVGTVEHTPAGARLETVKAHDAVLQTLVDAGITVVAARFRQTFADDEDARRHVDDHGERVTRVLEEYDGCVEMRVLLRDADPIAVPVTRETTEPAGPGHAYLEQLRARHATPLHQSLAPLLGPIVRGERAASLPGGRAGGSRQRTGKTCQAISTVSL